MSAKVGFDEYKKNKVITASGVELIVQLYDEAIKNIQLARIVLMKGNKLSLDEIKIKSKAIGKSVNIVTGLANSLDMEKGGDIAVNLGRLYEFINMRLLSANVNNDPIMLDEALRVLHELHEAWVGILKQSNKSKTVEAGKSQDKLEERFPSDTGGYVKKVGVNGQLEIKT